MRHPTVSLYHNKQVACISALALPFWFGPILSRFPVLRWQEGGVSEKQFFLL